MVCKATCAAEQGEKYRTECTGSSPRFVWRLGVINDVSNSVLEHEEPDSGGSGVMQSTVEI